MLNKAMLLGHVGKDPEIRALPNGDKVASFSLATSERWKDTSGERRERTDWHKIVVHAAGLVSLVEQHVRKGARLYIEGKIQGSSYERDGETRHVTEIIVAPLASRIVLLSPHDDTARGSTANPARWNTTPPSEMNDDIAF